MAKLVVEVLDASDLIPEDEQGSASPFVEVEFDDQRQRTETKEEDLNPSWNEKLVFNVSDPRDLPNKTIDLVICNDREGHKNLLGQVQISGAFLSNSESEAAIQRYPLDKRGDIALKIYADNLGDDTELSDEKKKKKKKGKEIMKDEQEETRTDYAREAQPGSQVLKQNPEFRLEETTRSSPVTARLRYRGSDKAKSRYDLVEKRRYFFVNVVSAKNLPSVDETRRIDPYVEVEGTRINPYVEVNVGSYKRFTKHLQKSQNPVWRQVFALSKDRLQSSVLEVVVKNKGFVEDGDFVGRVLFDLLEVPVRVPPESPVAPAWYRLEDKKGEKVKGEIMLAIWMGTQADEAFPEAYHFDAQSVNPESLSATRSNVYLSPKLYYLRVYVIEARDLEPSDKDRVPEMYVRLTLGSQARITKPVSSVNPQWNEEIILVTSEPLDNHLIVTVEGRFEPGKVEILGRMIYPVSVASRRLDLNMLQPDAEWFNLVKFSPTEEVIAAAKKKEPKIHLRLFLDTGYHVLDEPTYFSSDFQPSAEELRKPSIGNLELRILSARNLIPMKTTNERTTDAYCVAKYGNKWIRTRTILDTLNPQWHEQYTWEVYDPCTVINICVLDDCHINGSEDEAKDKRIGNVRIRLSTLETDRICTHSYPLLVLHPSGLKKTGELQLAIRFNCTAWMTMRSIYFSPLLPKMHYLQPIPARHIDILRHQAMQIVAARLMQAEPPLRREAMECVLGTDHHMWSLRRSKANFTRIMSLLSVFMIVGKWFDDISNWKKPLTTVLVHVMFLIPVCYPGLILPSVFLYLFLIGIWNYRFRPTHPPLLDIRLSYAVLAHPDELDEEFDTFPTSSPADLMRMRYDRLRTFAGRLQTVVGKLATLGERTHALVSWQDPRATVIFVFFTLVLAIFLYVTPFYVVLLGGLYLLRPPMFRGKMPSVVYNFHGRLPDKRDMILEK